MRDNVSRNPWLDLCRALAILLVLLSHGRVFLRDALPWAEVLRFGGFMGVELFFVLSGFLIGGILLRVSRQPGTAWLRVFYVRRWLRTLPNYYLFLLLTVVVMVVSIRLQDSRIGRAWFAIREDEIAAKAMGINTRNVKLLAFAMGASFGGVSGAMFAAFQGFVSPESFVLMESVVIVAMVVLGGMGHVPGVILGAIILYAIPETLRFAAKPVQEAIFGQEIVAPEALRMLLFGLAMVAIMLYRPAGLWPAPAHGRTRVDRKAKAPVDGAPE